MMTVLQASWGYILVIGGLFVTLLILMILDAPAQRRDELRRSDDVERARGKLALQSPDAASHPGEASLPKAPRTTV
jgi:hypothetical protein